MRRQINRPLRPTERVDTIANIVDGCDAQSEVLADLDGLTGPDLSVGHVELQVRIESHIEFDDGPDVEFKEGLNGHLADGHDDRHGHAQLEDTPNIRWSAPSGSTDGKHRCAIANSVW